MGRLTADDFQAWPPQGLQARCGRGRRTPPPSNSAQSQSLQPPKPAKAAPTELIYSFRTSWNFLCSIKFWYHERYLRYSITSYSYSSIHGRTSKRFFVGVPSACERRNHPSPSCGITVFSAVPMSNVTGLSFLPCSEATVASAICQHLCGARPELRAGESPTAPCHRRGDGKPIRCGGGGKNAEGTPAARWEWQVHGGLY